jgi:hypothetical protein
LKDQATHLRALVRGRASVGQPSPSPEPRARAPCPVPRAPCPDKQCTL